MILAYLLLIKIEPWFTRLDSQKGWVHLRISAQLKNLHWHSNSILPVYIHIELSILENYLHIMHMCNTVPYIALANNVMISYDYDSTYKRLYYSYEYKYTYMTYIGT